MKGGNDELLCVRYKSIYQLHVQGLFTFKSINYITEVADEYGFSGVCQNQQIPNTTE